MWKRKFIAHGLLFSPCSALVPLSVTASQGCSEPTETQDHCPKPIHKSVGSEMFAKCFQGTTEQWEVLAIS